VVKHETGSEDIESMSGLRQRMPLVTFALLVGVVTILLPPFGAFASKWMISEIASDYPLLAIPLAIGFGASVVFYAKWVGQAFAIGTISNPYGLLKGVSGAPFKIGLWALIVGAVGLPFLLLPMTEVLIEPFIGISPTDPLTLSTPYGEIPLLALLLIALVSVMAIAAFVRPKEQEATTAYSGGEPYSFDVAGAYFISAPGQRKLNDAANALSIFVLALIIIMPLMQEASLWLT
jgi:ech hydrogenase subunit A